MPACDHPNIFSTLNTGATWRVKGPDNIPQDVVAAFQVFTTELIAIFNQSSADEGLINQSVTDGTTALSKAYFAFWAAHLTGLRQRGLRRGGQSVNV